PYDKTYPFSLGSGAYRKADEVESENEQEEDKPMIRRGIAPVKIHSQPKKTTLDQKNRVRQPLKQPLTKYDVEKNKQTKPNSITPDQEKRISEGMKQL